jgi:hypothetical protein
MSFLIRARSGVKNVFKYQGIFIGFSRVKFLTGPDKFDKISILQVNKCANLSFQLRYWLNLLKNLCPTKQSLFMQ